MIAEIIMSMRKIGKYRSNHKNRELKKKKNGYITYKVIIVARVCNELKK